MLSYELRPDNTLQVSLTFRKKYAGKKFGPDKHRGNKEQGPGCIDAHALM